MAYLDPGSGSFILQVLIAAILGGMIAFRTYIGRAINYLRGIVKRNNPDEPDEADEEIE